MLLNAYMMECQRGFQIEPGSLCPRTANHFRSLHLSRKGRPSEFLNERAGDEWQALIRRGSGGQGLSPMKFLQVVR